MVQQTMTCRYIKNNFSRYVFLSLIVSLAIIFALLDGSNLYAENSNGHNMAHDNNIRIYTNKDCYVWFEANTRKDLDVYLKHADGWRMIGKPIVTSRIHNVESFAQILNANDVDAICGFKTSNAFCHGDIYDGKAWAQIAYVARCVSKLTGGKPVVLENEGTVAQLVNSHVNSIDYERLLKVISTQQWPKIWFWYAPTGRKEPVRTMSNNIARAIMNSIPNARLIEASSAGYTTSPFDTNSKNNLKRTFSLDHSPISIIYLDDNKSNFWRMHDTDKAIKAAAGNTIILYPGFDDIGNSQAVKESLNNHTNN